MVSHIASDEENLKDMLQLWPRQCPSAILVAHCIDDVDVSKVEIGWNEQRKIETIWKISGKVKQLMFKGKLTMNF